MEILLFFFELCAMVCIFINILHINRNNSLVRLTLSCLLTFAWTVYLYLSSFIIPASFVIWAIIFLLFSEKWYLKLCWFFVSSLALNIVSNLVIYLAYFITGMNLLYNKIYYFYSSIAILLFVIVFSFLVRRRISAHFSTLREFQATDYFLIIGVTLVDFFLSSVSNLLFYDNINKTGRFLLIFAILIMIVASIILLLLRFQLQHYHRLLQQTNEMNQMLLQLEESHYRDLEKKNTDLRAFRHDYNYHIIAMQKLASGNDLRELKNYVTHLSSLKEQFQYISTNHPVADAIINHFCEIIPKQTHFHVEGKFSEIFFVTDSDLCIIISNLLRNAYEAVTKLSKNNDTKINIFLHSDMEYISIVIENTSESYSEQQLQELQTSKSDTINHGLGLKNVRNTVQKYQGTLQLQYKENIFASVVYLPNIE